MPAYRYVITLFVEVKMKPGIHPDYQKVVFHDTAADTYFVVGSTIKTDRTINYEGQTYPYVTIDVSRAC